MPQRQKADDHYRKKSTVDDSYLKSTAGCCCHEGEYSPRRYEGTKSNYHQGDTQNDHDLYNVPEEKVSDEGSMTEETDFEDNPQGVKMNLVNLKL